MKAALSVGGAAKNFRNMLESRSASVDCVTVTSRASKHAGISSTVTMVT